MIALTVDGKTLALYDTQGAGNSQAAHPGWALTRDAEGVLSAPASAAVLSAMQAPAGVCVERILTLPVGAGAGCALEVGGWGQSEEMNPQLVCGWDAQRRPYIGWRHGTGQIGTVAVSRTSIPIGVPVHLAWGRQAGRAWIVANGRTLLDESYLSQPTGGLSDGAPAPGQVLSVGRRVSSRDADLFTGPGLLRISAARTPAELARAWGFDVPDAPPAPMLGGYFGVSTKNLARGLPAEAWDIAGGQALYPKTNLATGSMSIPYRDKASQSTWLLEVDFGAPVLLDLVALFDVRAPGASVLQARLSIPGIQGTWDLTMGHRGDGSVLLPIPIESRRWEILVTLSKAAPITIGEVWMGRRTLLPEYAAESEKDPGYASLANGDFVSETEPQRHRLGWTWPPLREADGAAMSHLLRTVRGSRDPVVVVPDDSRPAEVYLGRLESAPITTTPGWIEMGHGIRFHEGRRSIG